MAEPLPGHLTRDELRELLRPVRHFDVVVTDALSLCGGRDRRDFGDYVAFNFSRSMGSGGGLVYGENEISLVLVKLRSGGQPHVRVVRATFWTRLGGLFRKRARLNGPDGFSNRHVIFADDETAADAVLGPVFRQKLREAPATFDLEIDDGWAIASRKGTLGEGDHESFVSEVRPVIDAISS